MMIRFASKVSFCVVLMLLELAGRASANAPAGHFSYLANSATVLDTKTGLTWQRGVSAVKYTSADAAAYCNGAEVANMLGGSGWRLPTLNELFTLVDFARTAGPFVDSDAFPSTPADGIWSSSRASVSARDFLYLDFATATWLVSSSSTAYVRCVR